VTATTNQAPTLAAETDETTDDPTLAAVLERARTAVSGGAASGGLSSVPGAEAVAFGTGTHLGSRATWSLRFRASDGAVREELRSRHLSFVWGSPGDGSEAGGDGGGPIAAPPAWEVDPAGVTKALELDDREALVLAALLRSGLWLDRRAGPRLLHMRLAGGGGAAAARARAETALRGGGSPSSPSGSGSSTPVGKKARRKLAAEARHTAQRAHPTAAAAAEAAEAEAAV